MNAAVATTSTSAPAIAADLERVLINGDLSKLTAEQRVVYYKQLCESVGLNPLTQPFQYLTLSGKLVLYARKDCTEQLRGIRRVSLRIVSREMVDDCYVVTAEATDATGRVDSATGAVACGALKGEAKANALMKAETKAKRRVTLSICGLGMLDESEVSSIPGAKPFVDEAPMTPPISVPAEHVDAATGEVEEWREPADYPRITDEQAGIIANAAKGAGLPMETLLTVYQIDALEDLHAENFGRCMDRIEKYARNRAKAQEQAA